MSDPAPLYDLEHVPTEELAKEILRRSQMAFLAFIPKTARPQDGGRMLWSWGPTPLALVGYVAMGQQHLSRDLEEKARRSQSEFDLGTGEPG